MTEVHTILGGLAAISTSDPRQVGFGRAQNRNRRVSLRSPCKQCQGNLTSVSLPSVGVLSSRPLPGNSWEIRSLRDVTELGRGSPNPDCPMEQNVRVPALSDS